MISQTSLEKFKKLYQKRFGKELDDVAALRKAQALLYLWLAIYDDPLAIDREDIELQTNKQNEDSGPTSA